MPKRIWQVTVSLVVGLALLGLVGGALFLATPAALLPEAQTSLRSTDAVSFSNENGWLTFQPAAQTPVTGLILYPGGRVPAEAYAPAAADIAQQGYLVVVVPMPFSLAFLGTERAASVQAAHPGVTHWALGGHSLGGVAAAEYAAQHPGAAQGLVFWASYPSRDVSQQNLRAVSVYGALDTGRENYLSADARARLPMDTSFVEIAGGNHEQFGYYTGQPGDPPAQTPRAQQQAEAVAATILLLQAISRP